MLLSMLVFLVASIGWAASLSGLVIDAETEDPVAGAELSLIGYEMGGNDSAYIYLEANSGEDGSYAFDIESEGMYDLTVIKEGYYTFYFSRLAISGDVTLDVSLEPEGNPGDPDDVYTLSGNVLAGNAGETVAGALIILQSYWSNDSTWAPYYAEQFSNDAGEYQFEAVPPGTYMLEANHEDHGEFFTTLNIVDDMSYTITLDGGVNSPTMFTLSGNITDAVSGAEIPYAAVMIERFGYWAPIAFSDESGFYSLELDSGNYALQYGCWAYESVEVEVSLIEDVVLDVALEPLSFEGALEGHVVNAENDEPIAGAMITLFGLTEYDSTNWGNPGGGWQELTATSDESGYYSFDNLPETLVSVMVFMEGYEYYMAEIEIEGAVVHDIQLIALPGMGSISGVVISDNDGSPVSAFILLLDAGGNGYSYGWGETAEDGSYTAVAPAGDYYVACLSGDRWDMNSDSTFINMEYFDDAASIEEATIITVIEGETLSGIDFGVPTDGTEAVAATVSGIVSDQNGNALAGAEIVVQATDGSSYTTVTNTDGAYAVEGLEVDEMYQLQANLDGFDEEVMAFEQSGLITVVHLELAGVLGVDGLEQPAQTMLGANYPNPFNPSTRISFNLHNSGVVNLSVYDLKGGLVAELKSGHLNAGYYTVSWNGTFMDGSPAASGIYVYTLVGDGVNTSKKMLLTK